MTFSSVFLRFENSWRFQPQIPGQTALTAREQLLLVVEMAVDILDVHAGLGRHRYSLDVHQAKETFKWAIVNYILGFITICLVKISISLMILRYKKDRWLRYSLYGLMAGLVVTNGACITALFVCPEPKKFNRLAYVQAGESNLSWSILQHRGWRDASILDLVRSYLFLSSNRVHMEYTDHRAPQGGSVWLDSSGFAVNALFSSFRVSQLTDPGSATASCVGRTSLLHRDESHDVICEYWKHHRFAVWI